MNKYKGRPLKWVRNVLGKKDIYLCDFCLMETGGYSVYNEYPNNGTWLKTNVNCDCCGKENTQGGRFKRKDGEMFIEINRRLYE